MPGVDDDERATSVTSGGSAEGTPAASIDGGGERLSGAPSIDGKSAPDTSDGRVPRVPGACMTSGCDGVSTPAASSDGRELTAVSALTAPEPSSPCAVEKRRIAVILPPAAALSCAESGFTGSGTIAPAALRGGRGASAELCDDGGVAVGDESPAEAPSDGSGGIDPRAAAASAPAWFHHAAASTCREASAVGVRRDVVVLGDVVRALDGVSTDEYLPRAGDE